jgi:hypothetical protein
MAWAFWTAVTTAGGALSKALPPVAAAFAGGAGGVDADAVGEAGGAVVCAAAQMGNAKAARLARRRREMGFIL